MNKNLEKLIKQTYETTPQLKNYETLAMILVDYNFEMNDVCVRYQSVNQEKLPKNFTDLHCRRSMMDFLINKYKLDIIRKTDNMDSSDISDKEQEEIGKLFGQVEDFIIENICKILNLSIVKQEETNEEIIK